MRCDICDVPLAPENEWSLCFDCVESIVEARLQLDELYPEQD